MIPKKRLKILRNEVKKAQDEINRYYAEQKKRYGKEHHWAYDEHYQFLMEELIRLKYGLKKYLQALRDANCVEDES